MVSCSIISPSYYCSEKEILNIKKNIKKIGFEKIEDFITKDGLFNKWAGSFDERLISLYSAWDSRSEVIMCCKGGSGVLHFLPFIKKNKLRKRKIFVGYSDITLLLHFLHRKLGVITIHGPNGLKELDKKSLSALKDALQMKNYSIKFNKEQVINGASKNFLNGKILGGNLARLTETLFYCSLNFKDKIVFFEECCSTEYKIFNRLVFLKNYPSFNPKAIVFGGLGVKNNKLMKEMIEYLFPKIPLIFDVNFGHTTPNISIPIGANCKIDFEERKIGFSFPKKHRKYAVKFD